MSRAGRTCRRTAARAPALARPGGLAASRPSATPAPAGPAHAPRAVWDDRDRRKNRDSRGQNRRSGRGRSSRPPCIRFLHTAPDRRSSRPPARCARGWRASRRPGAGCNGRAGGWRDSDRGRVRPGSENDCFARSGAAGRRAGPRTSPASHPAAAGATQDSTSRTGRATARRHRPL